MVAITSPAGKFTYDYGSEVPQGSRIDKIHLLANLVKVTLPGNGQRQYHYSLGRTACTVSTNLF